MIWFGATIIGFRVQVCGGRGHGRLVSLDLPQIMAVAAVRYLSFVFACGKACDKIVLLARMVESDPWIERSCQKESKWPWQLWQNQRATLEPSAIAKSS